MLCCTKVDEGAIVLHAFLQGHTRTGISVCRTGCIGKGQIDCNMAFKMHAWNIGAGSNCQPACNASCMLSYSQ